MQKSTGKIIRLFVIYFLLLLLNSIFIFRNPWVDWDIVSYIGNVKYIEGSYNNIKITTPEDLKYLEI